MISVRLHPTVAAALSEQEKQLLYDYDLSRLDVFEAQAYLQRIDTWLDKIERKRLNHLAQQQICSGCYSSSKQKLRFDRVMKTFLRLVLSPVDDVQTEKSLQEFSIVLDLASSPEMELRAPTTTKTKRKKWVSSVEEDQADPLSKEEGMDEAAPRHDFVYYLLPVAGVGCGLLADLLQTSSVLVRLRLNHCQISDAGAILLASGLRLSTSLLQLDLSNDLGEDAMANRIGARGVLAIALALEKNQTIQQVSLSRNPVEEGGAIALATMIPKNVCLQCLDLDGIEVSDAAEALIDAFVSSKTLKRLSMLWCGLYPGVGTKLAAAQAAKISL